MIELNTIYNEDCLTGMKRIEDNSIDIVISDPPYFIDGMGDDWNRSMISKKTEKAKTIGGLPVGMKFDPNQGKKLECFMQQIAINTFRTLKPGSFCLIFSQARLEHNMANAFESSGFEIRDVLFWKRRSQPKAFSQNHFIKKMKISEEEKQFYISELNGRKTPQLMQEIEPILLCQKPKEGTNVDNWLKYGVGLIETNMFGSFPSTIMEFERDKNKIHITQKPSMLIEHLINIFTKNGDTVLDPFMGSGTTAISCINTNRNFIGFEIDTIYCDLANKRIQDVVLKTQ